MSTYFFNSLNNSIFLKTGILANVFYINNYFPCGKKKRVVVQAIGKVFVKLSYASGSAVAFSGRSQANCIKDKHF